MSDWADYDGPGSYAENDSTLSPNSTFLSSDPSNSTMPAWHSPTIHPHAPDQTATGVKQPYSQAAAYYQSDFPKPTRPAATAPPDTPEIPEAGSAVPSYAFRKPPRPVPKQKWQYEPPQDSDPNHVPVNWIGDSTDHADYRPANTASFSNHEADIVRVATFSNQGQKANATADGAAKSASPRKKRRWTLWAVLGVAAGTALGIAYKTFGDSFDLDAFSIRLGRPVGRHQTAVSEPPSSTGTTDNEMMLQLLRRRAKRVSQT